VCKQPAPRLVSKVDPHHPIGRLTPMTLGKFFVAGLVALLGGTIKPAHAQFPYPIPPPAAADFQPIDSIYHAPHEADTSRPRTATYAPE
jgi:hypothetical protein